MKRQSGSRNRRIAPVILIVLILFFVIAAGCTEVVESVGEAATKASEEAGSTIDSAGVGTTVIHGASNAVYVYQSEPAQDQPSILVFNEMITIPHNHLHSYPIAGDQGYQFNIEIKTDGAPVNVLIMDHDTYLNYLNAYKHSSSISFTAVTYTYVVSKNFSYMLPSQGQYYLVIDNSGFLKDGADAKRAVNVQIKVGLIR